MIHFMLTPPAQVSLANLKTDALITTQALVPSTLAALSLTVAINVITTCESRF